MGSLSPRQSTHASLPDQGQAECGRDHQEESGHARFGRDDRVRDRHLIEKAQIAPIELHVTKVKALIEVPPALKKSVNRLQVALDTAEDLGAAFDEASKALREFIH